MAKNFIKNGTTADFVAVADVVSGDVVVLGGLMGVANADVLTGETGVAMIEGVFELPKVTGVAMSQGDFVGYDAASGKMIAEGGTGAAYVMADAVENDETVLVKINAGAGAGGGSEGGKMPIPEGGVTLTVGAGGDYATLGEAIEGAAATYEPTNSGDKVTVNILAGTVLSEQVILDNGLDLSFIHIVGEDVETTVTWSALTLDYKSLWARPFIGVYGGTISPIFDFNIVYDVKDSSESNRFGVYVHGSGSVFNGDRGNFKLKGVGDQAFLITDSGHANLSNSIIESCGEWTVSEVKNASLIANSMVIKTSPVNSIGLLVNYSSWCVANQIDLTDAGGKLRVDYSSHMQAHQGKFRQGASDDTGDIQLGNGSILQNGQGTGGSNVTVNQVGSNGILLR